MRRITLLFATVAAIVGLGAPALAADDAYPPTPLLVTVSDLSPEPGAPFDVTVRGCAAGSVIDFEFAGDETSVPCVVVRAIAASPGGPSGAATQPYIAPTEGGKFTGTVSLSSTGATIGTFQVDVSTAVLASMTTSSPVTHELDWTPGVLSLTFVVMVAITAAVGIRLRLLNE